jgi:thiol-disulfide isomerase/thioredoxin
MNKRYFLLLLVMSLGYMIHAQSYFNVKNAVWKAELEREDGQTINFNFEVAHENNKPVWYVMNAGERIRIDDISFDKDSLIVKMPVFESEFHLALDGNNLAGTWFKQTSKADSWMKFYAEPGKERFAVVNKKPVADISGRWAVDIVRPNNTVRPAIAEFKQTGNYLTGTILTPSGDARFLEGVVSGDSLFLSTFDGSHAYAYAAKIIDAETISGGWFYQGYSYKEAWAAKKDSNASLEASIIPPTLKEGAKKLDFAFKNLEGQTVSINDDRFKDKVVIVQIMGSWCPNCMDETQFLSKFYDEYKHKGIEVVSLAYESSTDFERSVKSLRKFQQRFNVNYPMLITGVWVNDELMTEKTLPQITTIKAFPTTIFLNKKGEVSKIHSGFYGPGSFEHHENYKKEFYETVNALLKD